MENWTNELVGRIAELETIGLKNVDRITGWVTEAMQRLPALDELRARAEAWPPVAAVILICLLILVRRHGRHRTDLAATLRLSARMRAFANARADGTDRAVDSVDGLLTALREQARNDGGAFERAQRLEQRGKHLTQTVTTLSGLARGWSRSARAIERALAALHAGDATAARHVLRALGAAMVRRGRDEQAASALLVRHLAAVTFVHDPAAALEPALWTTEHRPEVPDSWSLLAIVAAEAKEWERARTASEKVLSLGIDRTLLAGALCTLAEVHTAGERFDRAEEYFRIALTYQAGFERPDSMIRTYIGLSDIYIWRSDWSKAGEALSKALALETDLTGRAELERRAGSVSRRSGNAIDACAHWTRARNLCRELGDTDTVNRLETMIAHAHKEAVPSHD
ncbi:MAG: hypothetical protein WCF85_03770 [Rhodospirillaceae bacterium]